MSYANFFDLPSGHAVAVSSGSAALFLALWALDGKNKRVGLPVYACAALRNAVGLVDGKCVYLDCEEGSPNVDMLAALRAGIDILIAPSMFGIPVDLPDNRDFMVVEDLAQSLGAMVAGKRIGLAWRDRDLLVLRHQVDDHRRARRCSNQSRQGID